jgi:AraC-like DNA-binding protein
VEFYFERLPIPELADVVRTVWIQTTGEVSYLQRHLPTGGVEIHWPVGGPPRLLGPLTGPRLEVVPARSTILGVRFRPGAAPLAATALDDLVDQGVALGDLWGTSVQRLAEAMAAEETPLRALGLLQTHLVRRFRTSVSPDQLLGEAVQVLMPWHPATVGRVAGHLGLSVSQLRRRSLHAIGITPKGLQRTLRFQAFLALAQAGAAASGRRGSDGIAGLAVDVGYADQAHLSRDCLRLTGLTPTGLLGGDVERCACGHEHAASYQPFLATRSKYRLLA